MFVLYQMLSALPFNDKNQMENETPKFSFIQQKSSEAEPNSPTKKCSKQKGHTVPNKVVQFYGDKEYIFSLDPEQKKKQIIRVSVYKAYFSE